jgi:hypothetical protein
LYRGERKRYFGLGKFWLFSRYLPLIFVMAYPVFPSPDSAEGQLWYFIYKRKGWIPSRTGISRPPFEIFFELLQCEQNSFDPVYSPVDGCGSHPGFHILYSWGGYRRRP